MPSRLPCAANFTMTTVALLHYTAPPVVGGVESVIEHHARLFASHGHAVRVIAGEGQVFDRRVELISLPLLASQHSRVLSVKATLDLGEVPPSFSGLVKELVQRLSSALQGVDVLFAHNVCSLHKNLALTAAVHELSQQTSSLRVFAWTHDLASFSARYQGELHPGYPWDLLATPWPGVAQVTISKQRQRELSQLLNLPLDQVRVVPNGVDPARFLRLGGRAIQLADELDLWAAAPLLLLPARLTVRKNIEMALQVLAQLRNTMPAASLVVTGPPGPHNSANQTYFDELKRLRSQLGLDQRAHFITEHIQGNLPDETVADFYRLADALLLPSREEGFGIPMLEAGLLGLPIFCTDIPPLRELGGEEVNYFAPDAEPSQVAQQIASRLQENSAYRLRQKVKTGYTWQHIYRQHLEPLVQV